jgi:histidinol dehydrogenase
MCAKRRATARLLRYAAQFDGLSGPRALRITQEEMAAAWDALDPALRDALSTAAAQIRLCQRQLPASWNDSPSRPDHRPARAPARLRRLLCSQRPSSAAFHAADDRDSRAGRGRARIVVVSPKPAPETLAAAHLLGITEFYRLGGAHAIAALGLWNRNHSARRQDRRPRQSLRHRGQAPGRL